MAGIQLAFFYRYKMELNIPTQKDLDAFEERINKRLDQLFELLDSRTAISNKKSMLTVKDVNIEFLQSAHIQRLARTKGHLIFIGGSKEVQYTRRDVEAWIESKTVR